MNETNLYTLKEIAEDLRVNYRTLLSCKDRFEDFVQGVPVGRTAKYPGELIDFFKMVFALLDEGYSTEKVRDLLVNGVRSEKDRFIETWLETWREALLIKRKKAPNGNNVIPLRQDQDDGMTGGQDDGMDGWTDDRMDGPMAGWTDGGMDGPMDERMTGWMEGWMDGSMAGGMTGWTDGLLTGGLDDRMIGGQDDGMTHYVVYANTERADGLQKITPCLTPTQNLNFAENLSSVMSKNLTGILQRMATENNIAITAICEAIEDIQRGIQTLDARLSALEGELGADTGDPVELYEIDPGDLQVSLPEPAFDFRLPPEQTAESPLPDPHGLAGIRQSIENGRPDKETVVQWVLAQRKAQPPPSYKKLAGILNDAKIPTLSGRDAWSRSTMRNLAVRAEDT